MKADALVQYFGVHFFQQQSSQIMQPDEPARVDIVVRSRGLLGGAFRTKAEFREFVQRKGKAGWGMVVVLEGEECESRKGPVETASKTNNVGEVMAVQQAIRWAVEQGQSVKIRYDSKYAANMVQGTWKCKKGKNIELIREAREEYRKATREVSITWKHVKAHSNHKWNDRADALADEGAQMSHGTHAKWSRGEQASQDSEEPLKESEACTKGGVRWVTYRPTETRRVLRSRTRHGCLNRSATKQRNIPRGEIERLASIAIKEILGEGRTGLADTREATKAIAKIKQAASDMRDTKIQKEERRARRKPIHTREIWCAVNTGPLQEIEKRGREENEKEDGNRKEKQNASYQRGEEDGWTKTVTEDAIELNRRVVRKGDGTGKVRLAYKYSEKGRDLFEAGHITGSREYATGADPFRWPEAIRAKVLAGRGAEGDDASAFPRARKAMVPEGRELCDTMIQWKTHIMKEAGEYLFPGMEADKQKKLMKGVINGFDMDSGLEAWKKKKGADKSKSLRRYKIQIGNEYFSLEEYRSTQERSTRWMADRSKRMVEFLQSRVEKGTRAWKRASLTAKSYLLQEAESTSRLAKLEWCKEERIQVMSLQHDGIMLGIGAERHEEARKGMSKSATEASGYNVEVVVKGITEKGKGGAGEEVWDMPALRATQMTERRRGGHRETLSTGGIPLPPRGGWDSEEDGINRTLYRDDSEDEGTNTMLHEVWLGEIPAIEEGDRLEVMEEEDPHE